MDRNQSSHAAHARTNNPIAISTAPQPSFNRSRKLNTLDSPAVGWIPPAERPDFTSRIGGGKDFGCLGFRISIFGFASDFGFRYSDLPQSLPTVTLSPRLGTFTSAKPSALSAADRAFACWGSPW